MQQEGSTAIPLYAKSGSFYISTPSHHLSSRKGMFVISPLTGLVYHFHLRLPSLYIHLSYTLSAWLAQVSICLSEGSFISIRCLLQQTLHSPLLLLDRCSGISVYDYRPILHIFSLTYPHEQCNVSNMSSIAFANLWRNDRVRQCVLSQVQQDDLRALRLVCKDLASDVAPILFKSLSVHFTTNTFTRRARMSALDRIGIHVRKLVFNMPHHADTFLPPLLFPGTLEEVKFIYEPRLSMSRPSSSSSSTTSSCYSSYSSTSSSKYGSWEMNDLLVKHYPPLFHAATDVESFLRAFIAMPNLSHLHISCPDQPSGQRYRRDIVDYALISLRLAIETANPVRLESLTLAPIHPGAMLHLRPQTSIGSSPASTRVWRRIKTLHIEMDSFEYGRDQPSDHLKILHSYLGSLRALENLRFQWKGPKGPCPLSLHLEPCTSRPVSLDCFNSCPDSSTKSAFRPLKFRHLKTMHLTNASLDADQASAFVMSHRKVLHEFEFEKCELRSGTWDDALAPLTHLAKSKAWKGQKPKQEEVMDIPIMLSPVDEKAELIDCVNEPMWDDVFRKSRHLQALRKVSSRTKDMVPQQVRKLLRSARVAWH